MERHVYLDSIERVTGAWKEAARRLGGSYWRRDHGEGQKQHVITTDLDGVTVHTEQFADFSGPVERDWTFATQAHVAVDEPGFELRLLPWDERYVPEVTLGNPELDRRVFIETNLPHYARSWLAQTDAKLLVADVDFRLTRNVASATIARILGNAERIEALTRAAARFASGGLPLRQRWRDAAEELDAHVRGRLRVDTVVNGMLVHIFVDETRAHTIVQVERGRGQRHEERLPGIEPDLAAWREAIGRLVAAAGPAGGMPFR
jgi:hypothetical protein